MPPEAIVLGPQSAQELKDSLFHVRCAAEDVATAVAEGAEAAEIEALCAEVIKLAMEAESTHSRLV